MNHVSIFALCTLAACAHGAAPRAPVAQPAAGLTAARAPQAVPPSCIASKQSHAQRIAEHGSALDLYHRQDGVWLPHAPVLVNEEFDFALAMSMEDGIGAGLAAAKRKENNQKRAQELAELRFGDEAIAKLEALCACGRDVYFLLWGREGMIKLVLEGKGAAKVVDGEGAIGIEGIVQSAGELLGTAECG
jgi:hypothetical protein